MQLSAFSHKAALPPLVSFGLPPDQHFDMSMKIAEGILPAEKPVMVDEDLKFAAAMMVGSRSELGRLRNEALRLRRVQQEGIRQVTMARDIVSQNAGGPASQVLGTGIKPPFWRKSIPRIGQEDTVPQGRL